MTLCFSALVLPTHSTEYNRSKFLSFTEDKLVDPAYLDLHGDSSPLAAYRDESGRLCYNFPEFSGFCTLGHTLFLAGGILTKGKGVRDTVQICSNHLWSFDSAAPPPPPSVDSIDSPGPVSTWRVCGLMQRKRMNALAVPYDGKVCIFGGVKGPHSWVEIYDPESGNFLPPRDVPDDIAKSLPNSYFLWERPCKKPLIVLYYLGHIFPFYSYDVEQNYWGILDCDILWEPFDIGAPRRNLIPLGGLLLAIDTSLVWFIYDFSSEKEKAKVQVLGLMEDRSVNHVFYRGCSDKGVQILYIFMQGDTDRFPSDVPYAKVGLQTEGEKFVATVESQGVLRVGEHFALYMFAEQTTDRTAEEAPLGDKKKNEAVAAVGTSRAVQM